jgi:hypothetical protein
MDKEQQRIAIAQECGWKQIPDGRWKLDGKVEQFLPDYLNDLNAMHEAEKVLKEDSEAAFRGWLWLAHGQPEMRCKIIHATAAQRAKAFLRTLDLWKP